MPSFKFLSFTTPVVGREAEYDAWFNDRHVPDLLRVPGILAAQRFQLSKSQRSKGPHPWKYLAIYDCEADDPKHVIDEIGVRWDTPDMPKSLAVADGFYVCYYEPISKIVRRKS